MGNRSLTMLIAPTVRRILYVAYALLPVTSESCGGAEQMLSVLEAEMAERGHLTTVAACAGSEAAGVVFATGKESADADAFPECRAQHEARILELLHKTHGRRPLFDLIHDKSGSFWQLAGKCDIPLLATLHLPRSFYPPNAFTSLPDNLHFNCVSSSQAQTFAGLPNLAGVVRNGIQTERFPLQTTKKDYLLWMGRVCEEKGPHLAIEVAQRAGLPLVLAGRVYPFTYHQDFYTEKIRPHLGKSSPKIVFFETPTLDKKMSLLANARALLVPSLVDETSSLVAMEAMACGTPVIGFDRGAIGEVVVDGTTGLVVNTVDEMAQAVTCISGVDPHVCRQHVEVNFSAPRMADQYEKLYEKILTGQAIPIRRVA